MGFFRHINHPTERVHFVFCFGKHCNCCAHRNRYFWWSHFIFLWRASWLRQVRVGTPVLSTTGFPIQSRYNLFICNFCIHRHDYNQLCIFYKYISYNFYWMRSLEKFIPFMFMFSKSPRRMPTLVDLGLEGFLFLCFLGLSATDAFQDLAPWWNMVKPWVVPNGSKMIQYVFVEVIKRWPLLAWCCFKMFQPKNGMQRARQISEWKVAKAWGPCGATILHASATVLWSWWFGCLLNQKKGCEVGWRDYTDYTTYIEIHPDYG